MTEVGDRVLTLRERAGLERPELERLSGLKRGHIWLIENKHRTRVTAGTLGKIATVVGSTIEHLLNGEGAPPTDEEVAAAVQAARVREAERQAGAA